MKNFEMAYTDKPEEIIAAAQKALINSMRDLLKQFKKDLKQPGLTWEQLDYFLSEMLNKKPTVIFQNEEI